MYKIENKKHLHKTFQDARRGGVLLTLGSMLLSDFLISNLLPITPLAALASPSHIDSGSRRVLMVSSPRRRANGSPTSWNVYSHFKLLVAATRRRLDVREATELSVRTTAGVAYV